MVKWLPWLCLAFWPIALLAAEPATTIPVYSYHTSPPFIINQQKTKGFNFDLVRALNRQFENNPGFNFYPIDRPSLNLLLVSGQPAIVMWVNPGWFGANKDLYLWSKPLFWDKDVVVSLKGAGLKHDETADLSGLRIGGIQGYFYQGLKPLVVSGKVQRINVRNDQTNIQQLLDKKVDAIIISKSSLLFYVRKLKLINQVEIVGRPNSTYQRQLLITHHYRDHYEEINHFVEGLAQQTYWRSRVNLYGLYGLWQQPDEL